MKDNINTNVIYRNFHGLCWASF